MKKFSFTEVMEMVAEAHKEEKKTIHVPHYYKRNGKILKRNYDDTIYTARYEELFYDRKKETLRSEAARIFKCEECGKMFGYWDLEEWCCNFDEKNGHYLCMICYEDGMGEDL